MADSNIYIKSFHSVKKEDSEIKKYRESLKNTDDFKKSSDDVKTILEAKFKEQIKHNFPNYFYGMLAPDCPVKHDALNLTINDVRKMLDLPKISVDPKSSENTKKYNYKTISNLVYSTILDYKKPSLVTQSGPTLVEAYKSLMKEKMSEIMRKCISKGYSKMIDADPKFREQLQKVVGKAIMDFDEKLNPFQALDIDLKSDILGEVITDSLSELKTKVKIADRNKKIIKAAKVYLILLEMVKIPYIKYDLVKTLTTDKFLVLFKNILDTEKTDETLVHLYNTSGSDIKYWVDQELKTENSLITKFLKSHIHTIKEFLDNKYNDGVVNLFYRYMNKIYMEEVGKESYSGGGDPFFGLDSSDIFEKTIKPSIFSSYKEENEFRQRILDNFYSSDKENKEFSDDLRNAIKATMKGKVYILTDSEVEEIIEKYNNILKDEKEAQERKQQLKKDLEELTEGLKQTVVKPLSPLVESLLETSSKELDIKTSRVPEIENVSKSNLPESDKKSKIKLIIESINKLRELNRTKNDLETHKVKLLGKLRIEEKEKEDDKEVEKVEGEEKKEDEDEVKPMTTSTLKKRRRVTDIMIEEKKDMATIKKELESDKNKIIEKQNKIEDEINELTANLMSMEVEPTEMDVIKREFLVMENEKLEKRRRELKVREDILEKEFSGPNSEKYIETEQELEEMRRRINEEKKTLDKVGNTVISSVDKNSDFNLFYLDARPEYYIQLDNMFFPSIYSYIIYNLIKLTMHYGDIAAYTFLKGDDGSFLDEYQLKTKFEKTYMEFLKVNVEKILLAGYRLKFKTDRESLKILLGTKPEINFVFKSGDVILGVHKDQNGNMVGENLVGKVLKYLKRYDLSVDPANLELIHPAKSIEIKTIMQEMYVKIFSKSDNIVKAWFTSRLGDIAKTIHAAYMVKGVSPSESTIFIPVEMVKKVMEKIYRPCFKVYQESLGESEVFRMRESFVKMLGDILETNFSMHGKPVEMPQPSLEYLWNYLNVILYQMSNVFLHTYKNNNNFVIEEAFKIIIELNFKKYRTLDLPNKCSLRGKSFSVEVKEEEMKGSYCIIRAVVSVCDKLADIVGNKTTILNEDMLEKAYNIIRPKGMFKGVIKSNGYKEIKDASFYDSFKSLYSSILDNEINEEIVDQIKEIVFSKFPNYKKSTDRDANEESMGRFLENQVVKSLVSFSLLFNKEISSDGKDEEDFRESDIANSRLSFFLNDGDSIYDEDDIDDMNTKLRNIK